MSRREQEQPGGPVEARALVERIAAAALLADETPSAIAKLAEELIPLAERLAEAGDPALGELVELSERLRQAAAGAVPPAGPLDAVSRFLARLQEQLEAGAPKPAASEGSAACVRDAETLELLNDFLLESGEGLDRADEILARAEGLGAGDEAAHELLRIFHSIKGLSGYLKETRPLMPLAHATESLLDTVRAGAARFEPELLELVDAAARAMRGHLGEVRRAVEARRAVQAQVEDALVRRIQAFAERFAGDGGEAAAPAPDAVAGGGAQPPCAGGRSPGPTGGDAGSVSSEPSAPTQTPTSGGGKAIRDTLRIDLSRVDLLVETIGELLVVESMVANEVTSSGSTRLATLLAHLHRICRDVQQLAMQMRAVEVGIVFKRMRRLVRELARASGKTVTLRLSGEATEMDRGMVDALEEPLVHLLRNAIDHGIETPAERARAGKPPEAVIELTASHRGGDIVVEVADDGRGLQRERIVERARASGLLTGGDAPSEAQIDALIFAPGFSTAEQVTEISGRGVGMDVVKRNVEAVRGRVTVSTVPGRGTRFRLVLPLTLAVIDGMQVACGPDRYLVPSLSIVESLQVAPSALFSVAGAGELLRVREEVLPAVRLGRLFEVEESPGEGRRTLAVVLESIGRKVALLVDAVLAQQQVVVKPLGDGVGQAELFSGAAILGDGRVGLILNVDRLCNRFANGGAAAAAAVKELS